MSKQQRSWESRLDGTSDPLALKFVESLSFDRRLYKVDIAGSLAHAEMLAKQKLISASELAQIRKGLLEIAQEIEEGKFVFDICQEDIHMAIEAALIAKIGDAGKKLHTGRSRNDQVALDIRLWLRDHIELLQAYLVELETALLDMAERYVEAVMPAYTHLQRAQPVSIAGYVLSFVPMFDRDWQRFADCRRRLNICPLGSGAVAGSTLPLDRHQVAASLGFADITANSMDAVSDRDFCAEFVFCCAMTAMHLSRLAEDWIIFASSEFGFVRIADAYCTSSSMMPQKRNPDMLELIRGKTATAYGALMAMLTLLKGLPSTYNRDLQEDKVHLFSAADNAAACLQMATAIVRHTQFNTERIASGLDEGFLDATALAEYLVRKGIPFRQAHHLVGRLVAQCEKEGKTKLSDLTLEQFKSASEVFDADVYATLNAQGVCRAYQTAGSAGPKSAKKQIAYWRQVLSER